MKNDQLYFILVSTCKVVKGTKRAIIIDYQRRNLYTVSLEYYDLLQKMDRALISDILEEIEDDESKDNFHTFLEFLEDNEIGFKVEDLNLFPKISEKVISQPQDLQNAILEIDETKYNEEQFIKLCKSLSVLKCIDIQIRLISKFNTFFLNKILKLLDDYKVRYVEIHSKYSTLYKIETLEQLIKESKILRRIFFYESDQTKTHLVKNDQSYDLIVEYGEIYYIKDVFDCTNSCGKINIQNLDFSNIYTYNKLKEQNGCLYRKISIDQDGNIKNCPSFTFSYGNIKNDNIADIVSSTEFQKYWYINKDSIDVCKDCEFRYNCTDCRAFIIDPDNIYSKPAKCSYNIITGSW